MTYCRRAWWPSLVLVAANSAGLVAIIRSRCQLVRFPGNADEDLHPSGGVAPRHQPQHFLLGFQGREKGADFLQVGDRGHVFEKVRLAADDQ